MERTLGLEFGWRRKLNSRFGETSSQTEVVKTTDVPGGLPLSPMLFCTMILTNGEEAI